jgi:2-iminobutanoate/2-iminopropanoate deaminase
MSKRTMLVFCTCVALLLGFGAYRSAFAQGSQAKRRVIKPTGAAANLPFSEGIVVGDTLYVAGHIGTDPKDGMAPADIDQEIKFLLDGFKDTVVQGGMTMDDLVSVQVHCTDLSLYAKFNAAYATYFKKEFPARMFVGSGPLLRNGHFEMMGIAVKR